MRNTLEKNMKHQHLTIRIVDRRRKPPETREKTFTNHKAYLAAMGRLMNLEDGHVSEETTSVVTIYPETQGSLFEHDTRGARQPHT